MAGALAGCFEVTVAHVPAEYLGGKDGNGWSAVPDAAESASGMLGTTKVEVRVYEDPGDRGGYPATMSVATLKNLLSPSEESLLEEIRSRVQARAERNGIVLEGDAERGVRTLADGHETRYFLWKGKVTSSGSLFRTEDAAVRILGEVWDCRESGTSVAVVGLAQTTSARRVGGVPVTSNTNTANWREIVQDAAGTIEGATGDRGLAAHVRCN